MKWMLLGFITTATLFCFVAIIPQETEHHAHWAYEGKDGSNKWATLDPAGEILIATDHTGTGHKWRLVNDEPWKRAYVVFKQGADVRFVPDRS